MLPSTKAKHKPLPFSQKYPKGQNVRKGPQHAALSDIKNEFKLRLSSSSKPGQSRNGKYLSQANSASSLGKSGSVKKFQTVGGVGMAKGTKYQRIGSYNSRK